MTLVDELELPMVDLLDPDLRGERWESETAALVADGHWIARAPLGILILDRASGEHLLRSRSAIFPGRRIAELFGIESGPLHEQVMANVINVNGADHSRLRGLVNPALTARAVERYRPVMRAILAELWAGVADDGRAELVEALAKPYVSRTIAAVMGAPEADADRLHDWSEWIQRQFDPIALSDPEQLATIERKVAEFYAWVRPLIARRRHDPADDLISRLIQAEEEGDRLSDAELENLVLNLLVGGVDTTQSQLAQAVRLLAERPEQWAAIRADPVTLVPRAVEEALRFAPITPLTARITTEEIEHRGVTFPEGTVLIVCAFTANREGQEDGFDVTAERDAPRMLTFGAGIHFCVGANLARAELTEALAFLAREVETLALDGPPQLQSVSGIYGVDALPLVLTPAR